MRAEVLLYVLVMALTTYLVRMLPTTLFRKKIKSRFAKSFFYYIPYAVLSAMTFPAILYATDNVLSGAMGLVVAILLALKNKSLITVAVASCGTVFFMEQLLRLCFGM